MKFKESKLKKKKKIDDKERDREPEGLEWVG